jgi:class 3 adenylate cyclase
MHRLENAYLNRSHFAKATRNLLSMKVAAQVYDFIFAARIDEDSDRALMDAIEKAGNVYFGMAFKLRRIDQRKRKQPKDTNTQYLEQTKWRVKVEGNPDSFYEGIDPLLTFPELASAARGLGSLSVKFDRDGVLRRVPLLLRYKDAFYPILPFRIICEYLRVQPERIIVRPGKHIILQASQGPKGYPPRDIVIPIDTNGNMVVNYIGPWERMDHYNFADILLASEEKDVLQMWREELKGKIVVISDVSTGSSDIGPVPTDPNFPLSGVLSNVMNTILTGAFIRKLSDSQMLVIELLLLFIILALSLRFRSYAFFVGTLGVALGYTALVGIFFFYGKVIFNLIRPLSMVMLAVISIAIYRYVNEEKEKLEGLRERDFIRQTFGRYLSSEVVEELLGSPNGLKMSGETREVTLLVSDLRGFSTISAQLTPPDVITMLNRYFEHMLDIIERHRGTVNELEGDGILAFFGAPLIADDDPERAVACAIEMQNAMVEINEEQRRYHLPELAMGIGINSGEVVVGNIGSEKRAKYGAVGSAINIVHRIETYTVGGQILISPEIYNRVRSVVHTRGTLEVEFKGSNRPVTLYDVIGINEKYLLYLDETKSDAFTKLKIPLRISCYPLTGKTVSKESIPGQIISFSKSRAEALLEGRAGLHSNLKILLAPGDVPSLPEVYAKIISVDKPDSSGLPIKTTLEFTWLPEDARNWLAERHVEDEKGKE